MTETSTPDKPTKKSNRPLRVVLVIGAVAVVAGLGIYALGAATPPSHVYEITHASNADPQRVFELLADYDAYPSWRPSVESVETLPDIEHRPAHRMNIKNGQGVPFVLVTTNATPPEHIAWEFIDESQVFFGTWEVHIASVLTGPGTLVTFTERGTIPMPFVRGMIRLSGIGDLCLRTFVTDVVKKLGEEPALS